MQKIRGAGLTNAENSAIEFVDNGGVVEGVVLLSMEGESGAGATGSRGWRGCKKTGVPDLRLGRMVPSKLGEGGGRLFNGARIFLCEEADRVKKELSNWQSTYVCTSMTVTYFGVTFHLLSLICPVTESKVSTVTNIFCGQNTVTTVITK
jgi:hypothetical protein